MQRTARLYCTLLAMLHPAQLPIHQLLEDCDFQRTRRSGPGGQHRNKVETAVIVLHRPSGVRAEANERRSQEQNRQVAIHRLRVKLAVELRTPPSESVSALWRSRTAGGKLSVATDHDDYPALLAEALNIMAEVDFEMSAAATKLAVTSSQLVKFLKMEPTALALVNRERAARGQAAYR